MSRTVPPAPLLSPRAFAEESCRPLLGSALRSSLTPLCAPRGARWHPLTASRFSTLPLTRPPAPAVSPAAPLSDRGQRLSRAGLRASSRGSPSVPWMESAECCLVRVLCSAECDGSGCVFHLPFYLGVSCRASSRRTKSAVGLLVLCHHEVPLLPSCS